MADYVAGRGTTALGIIGTILGSLGTAGTIGVGTNMLGTAGGAMANQNIINLLEAGAEKDKRIAELEANRYSDASDLAVYKYFQGELDKIKTEFNAKFTEQAVINSTTNAALSVLNNQVAASQQLLSNITKTAIPTSAICNFNAACNNCGG